MLAALVTAGGVFLVVSLLFMARHEFDRARVANGMASAFLLVFGILSHLDLVIALGAFSLALVFIRRGGPRKRRRVKRVLGNKSRQLRSGLVRRLAQRRVDRPGWSPSPSPSR